MHQNKINERKIIYPNQKTTQNVVSHKDIIIACLYLSFIYLSLKANGVFLKELLISAAVIGLALLSSGNKNLTHKNKY